MTDSSGPASGIADKPANDSVRVSVSGVCPEQRRINSNCGQQSVIIDAAYPGLNDSEGELLVQDDGSPAPYLQEMMKFLDAYESDLERTRQLCARIVELGLLKGVQIDVTLPDGQVLGAGGVQIVDETKLKALPEAAALELLRSGALGLLHAHLVSTTNVQRLSERLLRRMPPSGSS